MRGKAYIVVFITASSKEEARKIARGLLEEKLAACVNILPGLESHFWWQGKIDSAKEALLVIKTKKELFNKLAKKVKSLHSYSVPEIIALPIVAGNTEYLNWINDSTR
ncbi:MAG: divalent-cation tolerance protein CutA [Candidatus Omnitrophota bacterium]|nr:divalent-cation tolerance protein CutA [Candidatus Omnitrophota bacterium]